MTSWADSLGTRVYLDANVFIYAMEDFPDQGPRVRSLFGALREQGAMAVTAELTLSEILPKPLRDGRMDIAAQYQARLEHTAGLLLAPVDRAVCLRAAVERARHGLRTIDALHLATAIEQRCSSLVTNDRGFERVASLRVVILDRDVPPAG